jgi:8-oxo-dGTP pyrophosphatase MutT (NUDIX family)
LYVYLTHTAWVDVVDAHNQKANMRLPIGWATDRGLWHRGVHVVVRTSDGKFVVGKRTKSIVFAPGMLEISLGGGIDSGETPIQAAQRETHEELGALLHEKDFRPLFTHRLVGYHPHYHKHTKVHLYVYDVVLPVHSSELRPQPEEVEEIRVLTKNQVRLLLRTHRMRHFGRLKWSYKLYSKAVAYSTHHL